MEAEDFATLPLLCTVVNTNQRANSGVGLGMRLKPAVCLVGYVYTVHVCVTHEIRAHSHSFRSSQTMKKRPNLGR